MSWEEGLAVCGEVKMAANKFPHREDEYPEIRVVVLEIEARILKNGRIGQRDAASLNDMILLVEKWIE